MKRVLVSCLIAAMFAGLVACGDNASSENTTGSESSVTADSGADVESQADSGEEDKAKDNKSGVHYDKDAKIPGLDYLVKSYSEIPDEVKEEFKEDSLNIVKQYLEETNNTYEIDGDLKYEGYYFQHVESKTTGNSNQILYVYTTTGSRCEVNSADKTEGTLCFYARYGNVCPVDEHTYGCTEKKGLEYFDYVAKYEIDEERLMTSMFIKEGASTTPGYTQEAGDGMEKYGNYTPITKVADLEKDPSFEDMKAVGVATIDQYMENEMEDNIKYTAPEYYGAYIMKHDKDEDVGKVTSSYLVFKSVISDTEGLIDDTEVLFTISFSGTCYTENGELTYGTVSSDPVGQSELGDSAYVISAYEKVEDLYHLRSYSQSLDRIIDRSEVLNY